MSDEKPTVNLDTVKARLEELLERNSERRKYLRGLDGATIKSNEERTFLDLCDLSEIVLACMPQTLIVDETKPKKKS